MSSFRDPKNPDCVRFPGSLLTKTLICSGLFVVALVGILAVIVDSNWASRVIDAAVLAVVAVLLLNWWPGEIITDQIGIRLNGLLGREKTRIPWKDVGEVVPAMELGGSFGTSLSLRTDTLEIHSLESKLRIVHTPRHPDRNRLLHEIKMRGIQSVRTAGG